PLGRTSRLPDLHYVQPKRARAPSACNTAGGATPTLLTPSSPAPISQSQDEVLPSVDAPAPAEAALDVSPGDSSAGPEVDEGADPSKDDSTTKLEAAVDTLVRFARHNPKQGPRPSSPVSVADFSPEFGDFHQGLSELPREELERCLYHHEHVEPPPSSEPSKTRQGTSSLRFLSVMSQEEILKHLHHEGTPPNRKWTPIFSVCYFYHEKDDDDKHTHTQAHTLEVIIVGRPPTSNAYYEPDSYRIDPYRLPLPMYPSITYDRGLFCSFLRDDNPQVEEQYPLGTYVEDMDPSTHVLRAGTVMDVPMDPEKSPHYLNMFDNGTTRSVPALDTTALIPKPPVVEDGDQVAASLPAFLRHNACITYELDGEYHKGFLSKTTGGHRFSCRSQVKKKHEDWSVPIPNLTHNWAELCGEGILVPGHGAHSFVRPPSSSTNNSLRLL
ncbi:hypothetical protein ACHAWF_002092, partial [Thalassiosira exigua]